MAQGRSIGDPQDLLIEQYKLYVEMADRISARRSETNKFYISLLTALLAALLLVVEKNIFTNIQGFVFAAVAILGIALCVVWLFYIV